MLPYLYVYVATMFFLFFYQAKEFKLFNWFFLSITIFSLSLLYYLRDYSIGLDTYTYVDIIRDVSYIDDFNGLIEYSASYNIEFGFILFLCFLGLLGLNASSIFFVSAILIYSNLFLALKNVKINAILYFSAFFSYCAIFFWSFNILRQMVAVSFVIVATTFLLKNFKFKFFLFVLIASTFHYSAIVCLVFYLVYRNIDFIFRFRWLLVGIVSILSKFILLVISSYYPRYSSYSSGDSASGIGFLLFAFYVSIFIFSGLLYKRIKDYGSEYKFFVSIFSIYFGLQLAFIINGISTFGTTRILIYFLWPSVFIVGIFMKNIDKEYRYIFNCLLFLFLTFYFLYALNSTGYDYTPFRFLIG